MRVLSTCSSNAVSGELERIVGQLLAIEAKVNDRMGGEPVTDVDALLARIFG